MHMTVERSSGSQRRLLAIALLLGLGLVLPLASPAWAAPCAPATNDCATIGGTASGDDCELSTVVNCSGDLTVNIPGNLTITSQGGIDCSGDPGSFPSPGTNLTLKVGGDLTVYGSLAADGGAGDAGGTGQGGAAGAAAGSIDIVVCGDTTIGDTMSNGNITARGGNGGGGGMGFGSDPGGPGGSGGAGGTISIAGDGSFFLSFGGPTITASGGQGGAGGPDLGGGLPGKGGDGGTGGSVTIVACGVEIRSSVVADGGAGGVGGDTTSPAVGGDGGNGANAGTVSLESGSDLRLGFFSSISAQGGTGGFGGSGDSSGDTGDFGLPGTITTNHCAAGALILETGDATMTFFPVGAWQGDAATAPCCITTTTTTTTTTSTTESTTSTTPSTTSTTLPGSLKLTRVRLRQDYGAPNGTIRVRGEFIDDGMAPPFTAPPLQVHVTDDLTLSQTHMFTACATHGGNRVRCKDRVGGSTFLAEFRPLPSQPQVIRLLVTFRRVSLTGPFQAPVTVTVTHDGGFARIDDIQACRSTGNGLSCREF